MDERPRRRFSLGSIGPAIIVASVVLGPGSIVTNSRVGWQFGYDMVWVLAGAILLLIAATALSTRLGVFLDGTLCEELARRAGRPLAVLAGVSLFLVATCFQFGNNLGILYAIEPLLPGGRLQSGWLAAGLLLAMNGVVIGVLLGFRQLYRPVERLMKVLVGVMIIGFAANLLFARPSVIGILSGLLPRLPGEAAETLLPRVVENPDGGVAVIDHLWPLQGLIGTTLSIGGAFYQSYLVRQKGWTREHLDQGLVDSVAGISTLGLMSLMIMITAASVLHGNPDVTALGSAADVALQLRPLFGVLATALFCLGIFGGAASSFLVNAMIGGTVLSDGIGKGGSIDGRWPKVFTVVALVFGMAVAIAARTANLGTGDLIVFAQAITVLGNPLLAGCMLWLATRPDLRAARAVPRWMLALTWVAFIVVTLLSVRTGYRIAAEFVGP